jgi:hypothetical protein
MGIRMSTDDNSHDLSAFSQDTLKIEISGPEVSVLVTHFNALI